MEFIHHRDSIHEVRRHREHRIGIRGRAYKDQVEYEVSIFPLRFFFLGLLRSFRVFGIRRVGRLYWVRVTDIGSIADLESDGVNTAVDGHIALQTGHRRAHYLFQDQLAVRVVRILQPGDERIDVVRIQENILRRSQVRDIERNGLLGISRELVQNVHTAASGNRDMTGILGAIQLLNNRITTLQKGHFVKGIGTNADLIRAVIDIDSAIIRILRVDAIGNLTRAQPLQIILFLRKASGQTG